MFTASLKGCHPVLQLRKAEVSELAWGSWLGGAGAKSEGGAAR